MKSINDNLNNLSSIMNQAVVRPVMNKGVQEGYIITNIAPNSLYEKVGLQNGDVIIDVNNNHMQNANDILQVLNSMQSGGSLDMNIKRRGKNETINYSIE
jgi:general secretion pathway protein C